MCRSFPFLRTNSLLRALNFHVTVAAAQSGLSSCVDFFCVDGLMISFLIPKPSRWSSGARLCTPLWSTVHSTPP